MKNLTKNMSRSSMSITAVFFLTLSIISCNNNQKPEDTKEIAMDQNKAVADSAKDMDAANADNKDAKFLVEAAEINLEEIQLGQLAQTNAIMPDVKSLGKMMETEHTSTQKALEALAAKKQIAVPTSLTNDGQDAYKKLSEKKGMDFDKAYCDIMVKGHKGAIDKFEKASTDATDGDIKAWAASMLPALRTHLEHSEMCKKNCEKM